MCIPFYKLRVLSMHWCLKYQGVNRWELLAGFFCSECVCVCVYGVFPLQQPAWLLLGADHSYTPRKCPFITHPNSLTHKHKLSNFTFSVVYWYVCMLIQKDQPEKKKEKAQDEEKAPLPVSCLWMAPWQAALYVYLGAESTRGLLQKTRANTALRTSSPHGDKRPCIQEVVLSHKSNAPAQVNANCSINSCVGDRAGVITIVTWRGQLVVRSREDQAECGANNGRVYKCIGPGQTHVNIQACCYCDKTPYNGWFYLQLQATQTMKLQFGVHFGFHFLMQENNPKHLKKIYILLLIFMLLIK